MKHTTLLVAIAVALFAPGAFAGVYLTGSVSSSTSNATYQTYQSNYGSASLAVDLGRYLRLSVTHSQEFTLTDGYKNPKDQSGSTSPAGNDDPADDGQLLEFSSQTHVIGNSVDLQLILYEGQIFVPYITGGLIVKTYHFVSEEQGKETEVVDTPPIPGPNLGAGLGVRLNKDFTLKFAYIASPGSQRRPFDEKAKSVWDKKLTMGITYQL